MVDLDELVPGARRRSTSRPTRPTSCAAATRTGDALAAVLTRCSTGYGAPPAGARWHLAAAILARAAHPFQRQVPDWRRAGRRQRMRRPARGGRSCADARARHRLRRLHRLAPHRVAARRRPRRPRRRLLQRQLRAAAEAARTSRRARARAFEFVPLDLADARRSTSCVGELRRGLPPRRRARRALELGRALRPLPAQQRRRHAAPARGAQRAPGQRVVYASSSSVYGDAERLPTPEDAPPRAVLALRRDQARRRAPVPPLPRQLRRRRPWRCATSPSTGRASARTWRSAASARRAAPASRSVYGDGRQSARLHVRRRRRRRHRAPPARRGVGGARLQHRRRRAREPQRARSSCSRRSPAGRWTSAAATASRATCCTPARTSRAPADALGYAPADRPRRPACARSSSGCAARGDRRPPRSRTRPIRALTSPPRWPPPPPRRQRRPPPRARRSPSACCRPPPRSWASRCCSSSSTSPWYLNYDARYALLWARDLTRGLTPEYTADFAPTPHPLETAVSVLAAPFGDGGGAIMLWLILLAFGLLTWLVYRLGTVLFTHWVGSSPRSSSSPAPRSSATRCSATRTRRSRC